MNRQVDAGAPPYPPIPDVTVRDSLCSSTAASVVAPGDGGAKRGGWWSPVAAAAGLGVRAPPPPDSPPHRPLIPYGTLVWAVYGTITVLATVDRFTTNVWPRQGFRIGAGTAGSDFLGPIKPGPWSVGFYDVVARLSGRYSICALNLLFATMMHTTLAAVEASWVGRRLIDFRGAAAANATLHKWNGIGLAVLTLVHVWSIFTPVVFHGYAARVVVGAFEWPLSERGPPGFKDASPLAQTMMLQVDDIFRLVEMTLLLGVALPLSVRWLASRWHLGIYLHNTVAVLYFIDIVRRHTHPHSWVLNTPFFLAWLVDLAVGRRWWRTATPSVAVRHLSQDYAVLTWVAPAAVPVRCVGPTVHLRLPGASMWERAHPFTAFVNRGGMLGAGVAGGGEPWSVGLVVRVYHRRRVPALGVSETVSHTHRISDAAVDAAEAATAATAPTAFSRQWATIRVRTWGPTHGDATAAVAAAIGRAAPDRQVVLIASGSAIAYLLDAAQVMPFPTQAVHADDAPVSLLYTVRDEALLRWAVAALADVAAARGGWAARVTVAYTGPEGATVVDDVRRAAAARVNAGSAEVVGGAAVKAAVEALPGAAAAPISASTPTATTASSADSDGSDADVGKCDGVGGGKAGAAGAGLTLHAGRLQLAEGIPYWCTVFFQGSAGLRRAVAVAARSRHARLVAGGTFDGEGAGAAQDAAAAERTTGADAV